MLTLSASALARADRDDAHAAGLAELSRPHPDVLLAANAFRQAHLHARCTTRQLLEQVALAFAGLPRASREIANPWEVDR